MVSDIYYTDTCFQARKFSLFINIKSNFFTMFFDNNWPMKTLTFNKGYILKTNCFTKKSTFNTKSALTLPSYTEIQLQTQIRIIAINVKSCLTPFSIFYSVNGVSKNSSRDTRNNNLKQILICFFMFCQNNMINKHNVCILLRN